MKWGFTTVVATYGGAAATFQLTVKYEQVENDENVDTSAFEQDPFSSATSGSSIQKMAP